MGYDIISGLEIIGADDDDEYGAIGADPEAFLEALSVSGNGKNAASQVMQRNQAVIRRQMPDKKRRYPLGLTPVVVNAGATAQILAAPQNIFRAERLVVPSDIAFDFGISDVKMGNQSQFVQNAEVPAAIFSEVAINTGVTFDTAEVGNQLSVTVRNKSAVNTEFTAAFIGTIAK